MTNSSPEPVRMTPETRRAIVSWIVRAALGVVAYGALLFLTAGTLRWTWGWVLFGTLTAVLAAHVVILVPANPELLAERSKGFRGQDVKRWDRWITMFAAGVFPMGSWVIASLDRRFGWTGPLPVGVHLAGLAVTLLGYGLFLWALRSNAFFAEGVRIQSERGHRVATQGPYAHIRHPGYAGAILSIVATPLLLGSPWAFIPALIACALYVVRTRLEDATLLDELPGYREYAQQVPYRLLPGIW